jgi:hypothetical protein
MQQRIFVHYSIETRVILVSIFGLNNICLQTISAERSKAQMQLRTTEVQ